MYSTVCLTCELDCGLRVAFGGKAGRLSPSFEPRLRWSHILFIACTLTPPVLLLVSLWITSYRSSLEACVDTHTLIHCGVLSGQTHTKYCRFTRHTLLIGVLRFVSGLTLTGSVGVTHLRQELTWKQEQVRYSPKGSMGLCW